MKYFHIYFLLILTVFLQLGCKKSNKSNTQIDNRSYINEFELIQENQKNDTRVRVISPKAIIDPTNNNIELFESSIEILNKHGQDVVINSGNSTLDNLSNLIKAFNNVKILFLDNEEYDISTNSFDWDLNSSIIDIDNPININFDNTNINAINGFYNIDSRILKINNTKFIRNIYNSSGKKNYILEIKSDSSKWFKNENTLVFTSNNNQVETTIKFLLTE